MKYKYTSNLFLTIFFLTSLPACNAERDVINRFPVQVIRPAYEKKKPSGENYHRVNAFFSEWSSRSVPLSDLEYEKLDSLSMLAYDLYESMVTDSGFLSIRASEIAAEYVLIPNQIRIGRADSAWKKYSFVEYANLHVKVIDDFRPRLSLHGKQVLYYFKEYREILPDFAAEYGVGGFIEINSYLMSNFPRYYETAPIVRGIIFLQNNGNFLVEYEYASESYETLAKWQEGKWMKLRDLTILSSD